MRLSLLDDATVDAMLRGDHAPPPGYERVAPALAGLRPTPADPVIDEVLVTRMKGACSVPATPRAESPPASPWRRRPVLALALVPAALVLTVGLAAADVLPSPAQRFVSNALGDLGVSVPSPDDDPRVVTEPDGEVGDADEPLDPTTTTTTRPELPGIQGLCNAYFRGSGSEHGRRLDANALRRLRDAARAAAEGNEEASDEEVVREYCTARGIEVPTTPTTQPEATQPTGGGHGQGRGGGQGQGAGQGGGQGGGQGQDHP